MPPLPLTRQIVQMNYAFITKDNTSAVETKMRNGISQVSHVMIMIIEAQLTQCVFSCQQERFGRISMSILNVCLQ